MNRPTRRNFLFTSTGAAAGSMMLPGLTEAHDHEDAKSGLVTGNLKPLKHKAIPGFLSAEQIAPHHTAHYGGALKSFVGIDAKLEESFQNGTKIDPAAYESMQKAKSSKGNSVVLHELYFDGLASKQPDPADGIRQVIQKRFGSLDKWMDDFVASAKLAAGWAILTFHPVNGRLYNVVSDEHAQGPLWLAKPLVVIDVYEHAFYIDYQNRKAEYVEKFMKFLDWEEADRRYQLARAG
jgi:superoxide dismutase, Fe-Mn family